MAKKELRISHDDLRDPDTITQRNIRAFKEAGLDTRLNEVDELIDDHSSKTRILKVRKVKYFDLGRSKK